MSMDDIYPPYDGLTPEDAYRLGQKLAEKTLGHQIHCLKDRLTTATEQLTDEMHRIDEYVTELSAMAERAPLAEERRLEAIAEQMRATRKRNEALIAEMRDV